MPVNPETTTRLTPMEQAMTWERMSGERLSDAERQRITDGGEFVRPTSQTTDAELIPAVKVGQTWHQRKIGGAWRTVVGLHPAGVEWTAKPDRHEMSRWENWDRWVRDTEAEAHE